jgi:hypothetical protein
MNSQLIGVQIPGPRTLQPGLPNEPRRQARAVPAGMSAVVKARTTAMTRLTSLGETLRVSNRQRC